MARSAGSFAQVMAKEGDYVTLRLPRALLAALVGMALAVGMLLDNSIVVLENIYRQVSTGMKTEKAISLGVSGVAKAILAATLTTATVFVPFLFFGNYLIYGLVSLFQALPF